MAGNIASLIKPLTESTSKNQNRVLKTKALANQAAIESERALQNDMYIDDKITLLDYFNKWS